VVCNLSDDLATAFLLVSFFDYQPIKILIRDSRGKRIQAGFSSMADKFAAVRWLNDNNLLSVHCQKHFLEPRKDTYIPGDDGLACYPGHPGKWHFRILAVGGR
jgi:hypothetical protein